MHDEIDLKKIIGVIRRQFWLIFSVVIALLILSMIVTYSIRPRYSSEALLYVDTAAKNILRTEGSTQNSTTDNARVESEVAILKSNSLLLDVVNSQNLVSDPEFGVKLGLKERLMRNFGLLTEESEAINEDPAAMVLQAFDKAVTVQRRGLTYLVTVSVTSGDPAKAARLANALAATYIRRQVAAKVFSTAGARDTLERQMTGANALIGKREKEVDAFFLAKAAELEKEGDSSSMAILRQQMERIETSRAQDLERLESLDQSLRSNNTEDLVNQIRSDAALALKKQKDAIAVRLAAGELAENRSVNLRGELLKIEQSLTLEAEKERDRLQNVLTGYDTDVEALRDQMRTAVTSRISRETLAEAFSLQKKAEIARNQYQGLLQRSQELDLQASLQIADTRIVSDALPSSAPSSPNKRLILAITAFLALGLGTVLAFVREYLIGGFTNEDQVELLLNKPLAAVTPRQSSDEIKKTGGKLADLVMLSPMSIFSESIRRLRVMIDQDIFRKTPEGNVEGKKGRVIMVSSALPGEGKSTIALSLARTYALSGERTLIIDCDMRKPSLHRNLGVRQNFGLVELLRHKYDSMSLPELTVADSVAGLTALLAGSRENVSIDNLLAGSEMTSLMDVARRHFDYIVLDTPPLEPVVDGQYLARHADVTVFVVRWASTSQTSALKAVRTLSNSLKDGGSVMTVLNLKESSAFSNNKAYGYYSQ